MQDCRVCQRLHYRHQDEGREIEVGDVNLISMCLETAPDQCVTLLDISLDIFEPTRGPAGTGTRSQGKRHLYS